MPFNKVATTAFALALIGGSDAFIAPAAPHGARAATTTMKASNAGAAAAAAALAAGVVLAPGNAVNAALFEGVSNTGASLERSVGFGQPNPSSDPAKNNAANGGTEGSKYSTKQWGGFADKFSKGGGVDYGSPKGTDFGKTAGNAAGEVADESTSTLKDTMKGSKGAVDQATASTRFEPAASKDNTNTSSKAGDKTPDSAAETAKRILGNAPETAADAANNALRGTVSVSAVDIGDIGNKAQSLDRQAKSAVGGALSDATPTGTGSEAIGQARAIGSQVKGAVEDARNSGGIGGNDAGGKARDLDRQAKSGAANLGNKAQSLDRQAKNTVGNAVNDATPNGSDIAGQARSLGSQVKGAVEDARNSGGIGSNDAGGKARDLDRQAKSGAADLGNKAQSLDRQAKNAVGNAVNGATPNNAGGFFGGNKARDLDRQAKGGAAGIVNKAQTLDKQAKTTVGSAVNDAFPNNVGAKARDLDRQAKGNAAAIGSKAQNAAGRFGSNAASSTQPSVADNIAAKSSASNYGGNFGDSNVAANDVAGKARDLDRQAKNGAKGLFNKATNAATPSRGGKTFGKAPAWQYGQGSNAKQAVDQVGASVEEATN